MTQVDEKIELSGISSRLTKVALTVISMLLLFVGPTYIPYLLSDALHADYVASITIGGVLFIVGLGMLIYLIRKKVIS